MAPLVRTRQAERSIDGISTQVVCTEFSNYIFIVLTQYGKIGTLVCITPDSRSSDISTPMLSTKVLLGKDEVHEQVICQDTTFVIQVSTSLDLSLSFVPPPRLLHTSMQKTLQHLFARKQEIDPFCWGLHLKTAVPKI